MASRSKTDSRSGPRRTQRRPRNGRSASQKPEKYRFAQNVGGEETAAEREYRTYAARADQVSEDPDVLITVPVVKVDSIHLQLEDLQAHVALQAKVLELVDLDVGVEVDLGKVRLDIKGVEAQVLLKVRLDHIAAVVDRVFTTLDRNPDLVESIGRAVEDIGRGTGHAVDETGDALQEAGEGAGSALENVGEGAGSAVSDVGEGAGEAVEGVGGGAGQAAGDLDQVVGKAGQAAGQLGQGGGDGTDVSDVADLVGGDHSTRAKVAAKLTVKELGAGAKEKVKELGERRRHRKAERHDATDRAYELADELDVDLDDVEGSGTDGRITVKDVRAAAAA
jgi:e3 binding domain